MQHFEDLEVGSKISFGRYEVTRDEVTEFASKYDPQAFHLDDEAAAKTHFGRLSASGWHTCAMVMRMLVGNMGAREQAGLGGIGVDELRWLKPVHPGDVLRVESGLLSLCTAYVLLMRRTNEGKVASAGLKAHRAAQGCCRVRP